LFACIFLEKEEVNNQLQAYEETMVEKKEKEQYFVLCIQRRKADKTRFPSIPASTGNEQVGLNRKEGRKTCRI